jgi:gamma-glutamyltranspeptidase/glutathione hydrolase
MRILFIFTSILIILLLQFACSKSPQPVSAQNGMVVSTSSYASKVGVEILKKGGNAIDATVAVGFALAVTYPSAGNLGGGGFMVIHLADGRNVSIDYREKAPLSAHRDMYLNEAGNFVPELSQQGITSAGVPGSVAGLIYALEKYGTLSIAEVIQPAIDLARMAGDLKKEIQFISEIIFLCLKNTPLQKKYLRRMASRTNRTTCSFSLILHGH